MQQLYPPQAPGPVDLEAAYAYPALSGTASWVRANMVTSLDGATQGPNGRSATVSSPPDRVVLSLLRRLSDVVLAGAGTVRAEKYGPAARPIAVVSARLDLDPAAALFTEATHRTIILTVDAAPAERRTALAEVADVVVAGDTSVDVHTALRELTDRGLTRVLCEGGPYLLGHLVAAGCLDELCYTMTPAMVGGRSARLVETPQALESDWTLGHLLEDGGTLLSRWLARRD
ncbi:dihydrofolate reductase family protein [Jiangella gansuensis]|uniref:dihydrofolate reductase family protein n=1 Tax=Jiangella gansuensis TaxID=281473 RepID=UPI00047BFC67|nr:dihydrofolate reductase family protein [Jiangella gansuensis]